MEREPDQGDKIRTHRYLFPNVVEIIRQPIVYEITDNYDEPGEVIDFPSPLGPEAA